MGLTAQMMSQGLSKQGWLDDLRTEVGQLFPNKDIWEPAGILMLYMLTFRFALGLASTWYTITGL